MRWRAFDTEFPPVNKLILVCDELNSFVSFGKFSFDENDRGRIDVMHLDEMEIDTCATHWMPIPKPVKSKNLVD